MWSLGVIVYIMLCGYPPFYSEIPSKQITRTMRKKIMAGHYDFPDEEWEQISPMAKDLIKKCVCWFFYICACFNWQVTLFIQVPVECIVAFRVFRLLKVNAEERLTVEQVLQHPWLSEAPNTQLQSPAILLDKVCVCNRLF